MAHSFVTTRLIPHESARWTSYYGLQKSADLVTRPFLALRIPFKYLGLHEGYSLRNTALFIVSSRKPTGLNRNCYMTVVPTQRKGKRDLLVNPPLSRDRNLYIHTFPRIFERTIGLGDSVVVDGTTSPHKLNKQSLRILRDAIIQDNNRRIRLKRLEEIRLFSSRDLDAVKRNWDTWSGKDMNKEFLHEPCGIVLEHLPFSLSPLNDLCPPYQELLVYKQLTSDYSWKGVTPAISWVMRLRERLAEQSVPQLPDVNRYIANTESLSELIAALPPSTDQLHSMEIPHNGNPVRPEKSEEEDQEGTWDDDPYPTFEPVDNRTRAVTASKIKIIVIDLFGAVFNREMAISQAIQILTKSTPSTLSPRQLIQLYIEREALQNHEYPEAAYVDISRSALKELGALLGLHPTDVTISDGIKCLLQPHLYPDVISTITALRDRGYTILGLSSLDDRTFSEYFQQSVSANIPMPFRSSTCTPLYKQDRTLFSRILEYSHSIDEKINLSQILMVTSSPFRIAELANREGFPTALVQRDGDLESNVEHETAAPTAIINELSKLLVILESPLSSPARRTSSSVPEFRVCGLYQGTKQIGGGSFGSVFAGFHVLTGEQVAMKVEMPTGTDNEVCVLPYEAQIYRQLERHQGFPSLKWSGMDSGAHVAILERLGVTLQQLRRVCRGRLSLKTVLMLAEQMLTRIEFVHSRGIIVRDIKPENFAMGMGERSNIVHLFDFGLAKLFIDPVAKAHIPFRQGLIGLGTPRYASYNVHFGRDQGRRDDIEALGNVLLFLLHGRLPWQGAYAPSLEDKLIRMGEMKAGSEFQDFLARSPPEFGQYFEHCRSLLFEERPNYTFLREIFRKRMMQERWEYDGSFDWSVKSEKGTLLPEEYNFDPDLVEVDFDR